MFKNTHSSKHSHCQYFVYSTDPEDKHLTILRFISLKTECGILLYIPSVYTEFWQQSVYEKISIFPGSIIKGQSTSHLLQLYLTELWFKITK